MKYIHIIFALAVSCVFLYGCGDNDYEDIVPEITVVKSKVSFDSNEGTGIIEYYSHQNVTIKSDADWCTFTVKDDKTIEVRVTDNPEIIGRNAQITLATPNGYSTSIPVNQQGLVFAVDKEIIYLKVAEDGMGKIVVSNSSPYTIERSATWFEYETSGDTIIVKTSKTTLPRHGIMTVRSGTMQFKITISQATLNYDDLLGNWSWKYIDHFQNNEEVTKTISLTANDAGKSYIMNGDDMPSGYPLVLNFDTETGLMNLDYHLIGKYKLSIFTMDVYLCPVSTNDALYFSSMPYYAIADTGVNNKLAYNFVSKNNSPNSIVKLTYSYFLLGIRGGDLQYMSNMTLTKID